MDYIKAIIDRIVAANTKIVRVPGTYTGQELGLTTGHPHRLLFPLHTDSCEKVVNYKPEPATPEQLAATLPLITVETVEAWVKKNSITFASVVNLATV